MPNNDGFTLSSSHYPCSVCGGTDGCKEKEQGQLVWFCLRSSYLNLQEVTQGWDGQAWRVITLIDGGAWAVLAVDRTQELTPEQREAHRQRRQIEIEKRERRRVAALALEMPSEERHKHYGHILSGLQLSVGDRQLLKDRGFTEATIEAAGFRTVGKYQRLSQSLPDNFPGYSFKFGYPQLQIPNAGILCPIRNHEGFLVGAQVRLSENSEGGRYRWMSKDGSGYLNGENPIACWEPSEPAVNTRLWLAEGTGIKPLLASQRLNSPVIGAAGGLFSSSPTNTRQTLKFLTQKYGSNLLTMAIDAGDVVNKHVMHRLSIQISWLQAEGYQIEIAWWGQVTKQAEDIDELTRFDALEFLSVDEFWELAKQYDESPQAEKTSDRPKLKSDRKTATASAEVVCDLEILANLLQAPKDRPPQFSKWVKDREFTPDTVQNSEFVNIDAPAPGTILAVKSGLGSGKTHQLAKLFGPGGAFENKGAIALFARNSLIYNFVKRVARFSHLNEDLLILMKDPLSCLALCTNSLKKFSNPDHFKDKILIVDEFVAVALHIACSSTHRKDRIESLALFKQVFELSESVIILDGMLTDWMCNWAQKQAPNKRIVKLENNLQRAKTKVEILLGTPTKTGGFDANKLSPFVAPMLGATSPFIVFSDSQKLLEQVEKLLIDAGKNGIRIDSKTVKPDSEERKCLDDCNEWIKQHRPDYMLLSPTAGCGVDISKAKLECAGSYFPHSYGLFRGVIATDDQMQMMARYRDPDCFWHISVPKKSFLRGSDRDYNLENINAAAAKLMEMAEMDISYLRLNKGWLGEQFLSYIEEAQLDVNNAFALKARAKESFEKDNLRECLVFALESAGHEVTEAAYFADGTVEAALKIAGDEVKKETAAVIFNAEDIDERQAEDIAAKWASTWEDRVKLIKAGYKKQLPGIETTELWTPDLIEFLKYDEPKLISAVGLLHQFKNPESATRKQTNTWAKIATERAVFLTDLYSPHLKVKALEFLNLNQFMESGKTWTKDSPELIELCKQGERERIINSIGFRVPTIAKGPNKGKPDAIRYLRKLLEMVGLKLGPCQQSRKDGRKVNSYSLDDTWLNSPIFTEMQAAVQRRFDEFNTEWQLPEVLTVKVKEIARETPLSMTEISDLVESQPDFSKELEQDCSGIDWRGADLAVKVKIPACRLEAGDRVTAMSQPRIMGKDAGRWLIWVKRAFDLFLLELNLLELYFE